MARWTVSARVSVHALSGRHLQVLDPADRLEQMQSRAANVVADVVDGQLIGEIDQRLEAGESSCQQVGDRFSGPGGLGRR